MGILRLRKCFASRSTYFAQDDKPKSAARLKPCPDYESGVLPQAVKSYPAQTVHEMRWLLLFVQLVHYCGDVVFLKQADARDSRCTDV